MRGRSMCLELYSARPRAFTTSGLAVARRVAKHAGLTLRQVDRALNLEEALETRALIGQAQGILMERYQLTGDQAMSFLRRTSQQTHIKVRDLADSVVTGRGSVLDTIAPLGRQPPHDGGEEETA
jgi:AmiR/NasT family two-component response regulator